MPETPETVPYGPLPQTLGWYRESANWLVGLSVGALAAAANFAEKFVEANTCIKLLFTFGGIGFLFAALCGIAFYYWLLSLGNALESNYPDRAKRLDKARKSYPYYYHGMLASFVIGTFCLTILAITSLYSPPPRPANKCSHAAYCTCFTHSVGGTASADP